MVDMLGSQKQNILIILYISSPLITTIFSRQSNKTILFQWSTWLLNFKKAEAYMLI